MRNPAELSLLHAECFQTPRPWSEAEFSDLLASSFVFLCDAPQGFLLGRVIADEAELLTVAVDPHQRRQGAGSALVLRFLAASHQRGAATAFLEVSAENASAIGLYQATGFAQVGRRKGYYSDPSGRKVDALVMSRTI